VGCDQNKEDLRCIKAQQQVCGSRRTERDTLNINIYFSYGLILYVKFKYRKTFNPLTNARHWLHRQHCGVAVEHFSSKPLFVCFVSFLTHISYSSLDLILSLVIPLHTRLGYKFHINFTICGRSNIFSGLRYQVIFLASLDTAEERIWGPTNTHTHTHTHTEREKMV